MITTWLFLGLASALLIVAEFCTARSFEAPDGRRARVWLRRAEVAFGAALFAFGAVVGGVAS